jgi:hypothetical protein
MNEGMEKGANPSFLPPLSYGLDRSSVGEKETTLIDLIYDSRPSFLGNDQ